MEAPAAAQTYANFRNFHQENLQEDPIEDPLEPSLIGFFETKEMTDLVDEVLREDQKKTCKKTASVPIARDVFANPPYVCPPDLAPIDSAPPGLNPLDFTLHLSKKTFSTPQTQHKSSYSPASHTRSSPIKTPVDQAVLGTLAEMRRIKMAFLEKKLEFDRENEINLKIGKLFVELSIDEGDLFSLPFLAADLHGKTKRDEFCISAVMQLEKRYHILESSVMSCMANDLIQDKSLLIAYLTIAAAFKKKYDAPTKIYLSSSDEESLPSPVSPAKLAYSRIALDPSEFSSSSDWSASRFPRADLLKDMQSRDALLPDMQLEQVPVYKTESPLPLPPAPNTTPVPIAASTAIKQETAQEDMQETARRANEEFQKNVDEALKPQQLPGEDPLQLCQLCWSKDEFGNTVLVKASTTIPSDFSLF